MMKQEESKQPIRDVTIKTEPGTSATPLMQRLPSLRPPRDLSLSAYSQKPNLNQAKNKKVYIPNLNVQRNKQQTSDAGANTKVESVKPSLQLKSERGRGRGKRNFIQLNQGVFAEGVPGQKNVGRGWSSGGGGDAESLRKPTLKLKEDFKIDKEKEESTMKQLLRDDFIDDPTLEPDFDNCPITLPLLNAKEDPGLKRRCDMKPVDTKENITINDVFNDVKVPESGYIFFQLPSSMPGLKAENAEETKHNPQSSSSSENTKPDGERCVLSSLPGGKIGKLQILKSGRARLVFGDTKMWLEMGTQVAFRQDLVSVDLNRETHTGHMMNLGPVSVKMMAIPDWESMIAGVNLSSV